MALFRVPFISTAYPDFKLPLVASSIPTTTPRKPSNRKNFLRQKLLKTLTPPYPNSLITQSSHENPIIQIESPNKQFSTGGEVGLEEVVIQRTRESAVEESVGILDSNSGKFSEVSIFKFGLWLIGAFVFQTVCAVWMLGSADFDDKKGNALRDEDKGGSLEIDGKEKSLLKFRVSINNDRIMANGCGGYFDGLEMQKKIEEIRVMAREVRERERMERRNDSVEGEDDEDHEEEEDYGKSGVAKEVRDRLIKMRERLGNGHGKLSAVLDDSRKEEVGARHGVEKNGFSREDGNAAPIFRRTYKFRGSSSGAADKSKGFVNSNRYGKREEVTSDGENYMNEGISGSGIDSLDDSRKLDLQGADSINLPVRLEEDIESKQAQRPITSSNTTGKTLKKRSEGGKLGKKAGFGESKTKGLIQDMEQTRLENEASKSGESTTFDISAISNVNSVLNGIDHLRMVQLSSEAGNRTGFWWLSLPYVLVIFMRRGLDSGGQQGLFILRNSADANVTVSYTVAFESHGDANNFCYILKTFFEDLEDFSAEALPITIKELVGVGKLDYNQLIVVKKGQLKLYAGQPLPDAEMALRSLIGQT